MLNLSQPMPCVCGKNFTMAQILQGTDEFEKVALFHVDKNGLRYLIEAFEAKGKRLSLSQRMCGHRIVVVTRETIEKVLEFAKSAGVKLVENGECSKALILSDPTGEASKATAPTMANSLLIFNRGELVTSDAHEMVSYIIGTVSECLQRRKKLA